jgi:hypothetical protein
MTAALGAGSSPMSASRASLSDKTVRLGLASLTLLSILCFFVSNHLARTAGLEPIRLGVILGIPGLILIFAAPVWIFVRLVQMFRRGVEHPARHLVPLVREILPYVAINLYLVFLLTLFFQAVKVLKNAIPLLQPFYFDHVLLRLERGIFGADAYVFTHRLFGTNATYLLESAYTAWHVVQLAVFVWLLLTRDYETKFRALLTIALCWFLFGSLLAIGTASVGPIFYDHFYGGDQFAPLLADLAATGNGSTDAARSYLLDNYGTLKIGTGISAMPSMHVSMAVVWCFIAARKPKWLRNCALTFAATILVGSVHLGWHWLSDGVVSIMLTVMTWRAVGWLFDRFGSDRRTGPNTWGRNAAIDDLPQHPGAESRP